MYSLHSVTLESSLLDILKKEKRSPFAKLPSNLHSSLLLTWAQSEPPTPLEDERGTHTPASGSPYVQFTPRRSPTRMDSFDNLVALTNYYERLQDAKKVMWRDRGEPVTELKSLKACILHAARGGARAAALGFNLRAAINLVLALIRVSKIPGDLRLRFLIKQVFNREAVNFGAMLGVFASTYKFLLNALPLLFPSLDLNHNPIPPKDTPTRLEVPLEYPNRKTRLTLSNDAQLTLVQKGVRKWHTALAGALAAALAIICETKSQRKTIAQQVFVRGLQGSYNSFTTKRGWRVPHGDVMVFSLACGQIVYAFMIRPETLSKAYNAWIQLASKIPPGFIKINRSLVRRVPPDLAEVDRVLKIPGITPANVTDLLEMRQRIIDGPLPKYISCATNHPHLSSCLSVPVDRFFAVFKWMFPRYGALHLLPQILFKRKAFLHDPGKVLVKAGLGTMRSSSFLGISVVIAQSILCYKNYLYQALVDSKSPVPGWILETLVGKGVYWFIGMMCGLSVLIEEKHRRAELAMYALPKALESLWLQARGKGLVSNTGNWGEVLLISVGMSMLMSTYQNDPQHLSGIARRILYQFIGPN